MDYNYYYTTNTDELKQFKADANPDDLYIVAAVSLNGKWCFIDNCTKEDAIIGALAWMVSGLANGIDPIDVKSICISTQLYNYD